MSEIAKLRSPTALGMKAVSLLFFLPTIALADPTCNMRQGSTCICDMSDGSGVVDLTPISSSSGSAYFPNINGNLDSTRYSYNPCQPYTDGKCTLDVAVCQADDGGIVCGKQSTAAFQVVSGSQPVTLTLTYTGGDPDRGKNREAIVTLICDPAEADISFTKEDPQYTYNFVLKTKYACPQQPPPNPTTSPAPTKNTNPTGHNPTGHNPTGHNPTGHTPEKSKISVGTILDITFLLVVVVYFVAGMIIMRVRYQQAFGPGLIPNRSFWMSLPSLIKDGSLFLFDRCRRLKSQSYEKL